MGKRSRAKGEREHLDSRQACTRDFLAPLLSLSPGYADSCRVTPARAGDVQGNSFIHVLVLSLGGFLSENIDMNSRDPR